MIRHMKSAVRLTSSALALTMASQVCAQEAQRPSTDLASGPAAVFELEEIVVTAQKRSERLSDVGMAITAATGDQLRLQNIRDVNGLVKIDPSFVVTESNYGAPVYSIRGINYNDFSLSASPTVSVYQDEVPYAYPALTKSATVDLQRVEVLKGPQGTLYGQNATGGAINYIAAKPTSSLSAGVDATYQSYNQVNLGGFLSGPLSDTVGGRIAFEVDRGGAYQWSQSRDGRLGDKEVYKGRATFQFDPSDNLAATLTFNGFRDKSENRPGQVFAFIPTRPQNIVNVPGLSDVTLAPHSNRATDWFTGVRPRLDQKFGQVSGRVEYGLNDDVTLTYLGSYQRYRQRDIAQPIGANVEQIIYNNGDVNSLFQELRLGGEVADQRLTWLVGANYARDRVREDQIQNSRGTTAVYAFYAATGLAQSSFANTGRNLSVSKAGFANLDFNLSEQVSIHAGGRYTWTDIDHGGCTRDVNGEAFAVTNILQQTLQSRAGINNFVPAVPGGCLTLGPGLTPIYLEQELNQGNFSWRAGVDFKPQAGTLLYATISKGYKAGSFPNITATTYSQLGPVGQESLLAYEAGVKSRMFGNFAEIDGSVFYYDYKDKQLAGRAVDPFGLFGVFNLLVNVPNSRVYGAEMGLKLRPATGTLVKMQGTYLNSRVQGDTPGYDGFGVATNLKGSSFPDAPKYSLLIDAQQDFAITEDLSGFVGANYRYRSGSLSAMATYNGFTSGAYSSPSTRLPAYGLLGFRVGVVSGDGRWNAQIFGENVTNKYYITKAQKFSDFVTRFTGTPATYGISVGHRF
ncbi:TonB-dependent receptor [Niveispirillum fermenti]|uniref:TonB-dependent receptor n=1 Tax=Niveispirillum fermenti TaxID=1233113 RepID=UPI003A83B310